jgi:hypothetical protein
MLLRLRLGQQAYTITGMKVLATNLGQIIYQDSLSYMREHMVDGSLDLIFTS